MQEGRKNVDSVAINGLNIAGKLAIGGFVTGAIGGGVGGFVGGLAAGMIMTGDFDQTLSMGLNSALYGGIAGGVLGGYRGYKAARAIGRNPWTGNMRHSQYDLPQNLPYSTKQIGKKYGEHWDTEKEGYRNFKNMRSSLMISIMIQIQL